MKRKQRRNHRQHRQSTLIIGSSIVLVPVLLFFFIGGGGGFRLNYLEDPIICTIVVPQESDVDIRGNLTTLQNVGLTALIVYEPALDNGTYDDDLFESRTDAEVRIANEFGMKIYLCFVDAKWTRISNEYGIHLEKLGSHFRRYPNVVGLFLDDWWAQRQPPNNTEYDDFVRQCFALGREFFTCYGCPAVTNQQALDPEGLVGKRLVSVITYVYYFMGYRPLDTDEWERESRFTGDWSWRNTDWIASTVWLSDFVRKFDDPASFPDYTIGPCFNAYYTKNTEVDKIDPSMWINQTRYAISQKMLFYCWYGIGVWINGGPPVEWLSKIKQLNGEIQNAYLNEWKGWS